MQIVIFEDDRVDQLAPLTSARPACGIGCGGVNLLELVAEWKYPVTTQLRPAIARAWMAGAWGDRADRAERAERAERIGEGNRLPGAVVSRAANLLRDSSARDIRGVTAIPTASVTLVLNARLVPSRSMLAQLEQRFRRASVGALWQDHVLVAAFVDGDASWGSYEDLVALVRAGVSEPPSFPVRLLEFPHDVMRYHEQCLQENLEYLLNHGDYQEVADDVFAAPGVVLGQYIVSDTTRGPIVLERDSVVEPYAYLCGPILVASHAKVRARAQLSGGVAIGVASRVGGEIQTCLMESYSNKQHDGFLGHSYLGSWVNLGAGTCVSNLKNTYGEITVQHQGRKIPTGMRFLGAIVGDYVKTAIQTSIFSGKRIGIASNLYGLITEDVASFVNYAKQFGDVTEVDIESVLTGQRRMMERRGVAPCDAQRQLLCDVMEATRTERIGLECRPPRFSFPHLSAGGS